MKLLRRINPRTALLLAIGFACALILLALSGVALHYSSTTSFCMSCHEMRVVGEQGWMFGKHYDNPSGVVAECRDCHIPPGLVAHLWVNARCGTKNLWVHFFGQSDPMKIDWEEMAKSARNNIKDASCLRCHANLEPSGTTIEARSAHRKYKQQRGTRRCLDCHRGQFHGRFRPYRSGRQADDTAGERP